MRLALPDGVECVCGKRLDAFVILAAAWRRMSFKQRDALCCCRGREPARAIRLLETDSCMSRTDGYPRLCRQALREAGRGCMQRRLLRRARQRDSLRKGGSGRALIVFVATRIEIAALRLLKA